MTPWTAMTRPDTTSADTLLSVIEVADRLSCSRKHVYRLIESGELHVVDISLPGSSYSKSRIRESDLSDYLIRATIS